MKRRIRLTESALNNIIARSVKEVLRTSLYEQEDESQDDELMSIPQQSRLMVFQSGKYQGKT